MRHWAQGGPTTLSNLALLCRRHHRAVHEEGYQVDRQPDGELCFRRPDGRPLPEVPPPVTVPADPVAALRARHAAQGLRLHARTTCPGWLGERLDVGLGDRRPASPGHARRELFKARVKTAFDRTIAATGSLERDVSPRLVRGGDARREARHAHHTEPRRRTLVMHSAY